jgi:hypothetical protein
VRACVQGVGDTAAAASAARAGSSGVARRGCRVSDVKLSLALFSGLPPHQAQELGMLPMGAARLITLLRR